jgi:hypothetical protein
LSKGLIQIQALIYHSIGGFYAFILGRNPEVELSVVARSNYDSVKSSVRSEDMLFIDRLIIIYRDWTSIAPTMESIRLTLSIVCPFPQTKNAENFD